jgi:hypothetical protein
MMKRYFCSVMEARSERIYDIEVAKTGVLRVYTVEGVAVALEEEGG